VKKLVRQQHGHGNGWKEICQHVGCYDVRHDLRTAKPEGRTDKIPRDAVVQFTVHALFSILLWWLEHNPKLSPAEADAIFRRLTLPALAAAGLT